MNGNNGRRHTRTKDKHLLDQICTELNLWWSYDSALHLVVFTRRDGTEHDLAVCLGSPVLRVLPGRVMRGPGPRELLVEWLGK